MTEGGLPRLDGDNERTTALAALEAIYASLPRVDCRRLCHGACGPIVMSALEWTRIAEAAGERACADDLVCPYLVRPEGLCGVYEVRPLICRLWGAMDALRCEWGCIPERALTDIEVATLIERVQALSGDAPPRTVWQGWHASLERVARGDRDPTS